LDTFYCFWYQKHNFGVAASVLALETRVIDTKSIKNYPKRSEPYRFAALWIVFSVFATKDTTLVLRLPCWRWKVMF